MEIQVCPKQGTYYTLFTARVNKNKVKTGNQSKQGRIFMSLQLRQFVFPSHTDAFLQQLEFYNQPVEIALGEFNPSPNRLRQNSHSEP
jgi:hypothetical protein